MHPASRGVANIRQLWCPSNISQAERSFGGRRSMARGRNVAGGCGVNQRFAQSAEEVAMTSYVRPACLALAFVATAVPASAQTWVYEPDVPRARVYEPRYEPRYYYEPGAYQPPTYESRAYDPAVSAPPLALTPAQRTRIYRTIIPQGRGRGPIVRERIVTETVARRRWCASASSIHPPPPAMPMPSAPGSAMLMRWRRCRSRSSPRCRPYGRTDTWSSTTACCWSIPRPAWSSPRSTISAAPRDCMDSRSARPREGHPATLAGGDPVAGTQSPSTRHWIPAYARMSGGMGARTMKPNTGPGGYVCGPTAGTEAVAPDPARADARVGPRRMGTAG